MALDWSTIYYSFFKDMDISTGLNTTADRSFDFPVFHGNQAATASALRGVRPDVGGVAITTFEAGDFPGFKLDRTRVCDFFLVSVIS